MVTHRYWATRPECGLWGVTLYNVRRDGVHQIPRFCLIAFTYRAILHERDVFTGTWSRYGSCEHRYWFLEVRHGLGSALLTLSKSFWKCVFFFCLLHSFFGWLGPAAWASNSSDFSYWRHHGLYRNVCNVNLKLKLNSFAVCKFRTVIKYTITDEKPFSKLAVH